MSIIVGAKRFEDKESVIRHCSAIRFEYACNEVIKLTDLHGIFLKDLITLLPSWPLKFLSVVTGFKTGRYATRNQSGFCWVDRTGSSVQFSYRACASGESPSVDDWKTHAAMTAITSQLISFRDSSLCDNCSTKLARRHTGYLPPRTFALLWQRFNATQRPYTLSDKDLLPPDIEEDWRDYHRRHAVLRALCVRCYYQDPENRG